MGNGTCSIDRMYKLTFEKDWSGLISFFSSRKSVSRLSALFLKQKVVIIVMISEKVICISVDSAFT